HLSGFSPRWAGTGRTPPGRRAGRIGIRSTQEQAMSHQQPRVWSNRARAFGLVLATGAALVAAPPPSPEGKLGAPREPLEGRPTIPKAFVGAPKSVRLLVIAPGMFAGTVAPFIRHKNQTGPSLAEPRIWLSIMTLFGDPSLRLAGGTPPVPW